MHFSARQMLFFYSSDAYMVFYVIQLILSLLSNQQFIDFFFLTFIQRLISEMELKSPEWSIL